MTTRKEWEQMARRKPHAKKVRLQRVTRGNRRVPAWVMMRSARRFTTHPRRHHWRRGQRKK